MDYRVERFTLDSLPKHYRQVWKKLIEENPACRRAFFTHTFCEAVASTGKDVRLLTFSTDYQLVGILPFQMKNGFMGRIGVAERVGGEMSDYFGVIGCDGLRVDQQNILRNSGVSVLEFSHLCQSQSLFGLVGESPRSGLSIVIESSGEKYWGELRQSNKKLVADTERCMRKLSAEYGNLVFELQSTHPEADLGFLIHHKHNQYLRSGQRKAPLFNADNIKLLYNLLKTSDPECSGVLSVLRAGDHLIAAHFGLLCFGILHYWFPVYDPKFRNYSPGRLLLMHLLRQGAVAGMNVFDLGEGDAPYKREFANHEHLFYKGILSAGGILDVFGRIGLSFLWRLNA